MKGGLHSFDLDNWLSRVLWGALGTASYNSGLLVMCPAGEGTFMSGLQALAPAVPSVWKAFPVPSDPGHHLCPEGLRSTTTFSIVASLSLPPAHQVSRLWLPQALASHTGVSWYRPAFLSCVPNTASGM